MESIFSPMPFFVTLAVQNLEVAVRWYADALGFQVVYAMPNREGVTVLVHLRRGSAQDLMLVLDAEELTEADTGRGVMLTFMVEEPLAALAARAQAAGATVVEGPVERPWGTVEVVFRDPDGYVLTFSQLTDADAARRTLSQPPV